MNPSSSLIWDTPWHALLKTLAQGLQPECVAHPSAAPDRFSVRDGVAQASWLGRARAVGMRASDA